MKLKEFIAELQKAISENPEMSETKLLESDLEGESLYQIAYTPKIGFLHGSTMIQKL